MVQPRCSPDWLVVVGENELVGGVVELVMQRALLLDLLLNLVQARVEASELVDRLLVLQAHLNVLLRRLRAQGRARARQSVGRATRVVCGHGFAHAASRAPCQREALTARKSVFFFFFFLNRFFRQNIGEEHCEKLGETKNI